MRRLSFSIIFCLSVSLSFSQVKILFDATKAETAGNADWVIDADAFNIYWNSSGGYSLSGSEANAQNIPTPAQSGITSSTAETYWTGGISAWGVDMVKKGYTVESLPVNGSITYGSGSNPRDLSNYKVFVVCEPNIKFTTSEKTAMINFVQNGGGLFMVADHTGSDRNNDGIDSPQIWNDFMDTNSVHYFGIHFDYADFSQTSTNIANLPGDPLLHGVMGNVTEVQWSAGNSMTLNPSNNPSVKGVVYKTGASTTGNTNCMVAYATYGTGRVVAFGDSSPCDDGTGDTGDVLYTGYTGDANGNHQKLIVNATIWLAGTTTSIDNSIAEENPLLIYPNPANDNVTIELPENNDDGLYIIVVCDISGKNLLELDNLSGNMITIPPHLLEQGMYLVKLIRNGEVINVNKLMIN